MVEGWAKNSEERFIGNGTHVRMYSLNIIPCARNVRYRPSDTHTHTAQNVISLEYT